MSNSARALYTIASLIATVREKDFLNPATKRIQRLSFDPQATEFGAIRKRYIFVSIAFAAADSISRLEQSSAAWIR
jgi:hypothetical protein